MSPGVVYGYLEGYKGNIVIVIADPTCAPQASSVSDILKVGQPDSKWSIKLDLPASTVGRPCHVTAFVRSD